MHYSGAVYRPPSEAYSLIVQVTVGCSHNKCAFCNMYKAKQFSITPIEQVMEDLKWARAQYQRIERIFLADGDALILPTDHLMGILDYIRENIPECERVATYASPRSILGKTPEDLKRLRQAGLSMAYLGLETGNEALLKKINREKGTGILFISHNLHVVRKLCTRVAVMCRGELIEEGPVDEVFLNPQQDYTKRLIAAIPTRRKRG